MTTHTTTQTAATPVVSIPSARAAMANPFAEAPVDAMAADARSAPGICG